MITRSRSGIADKVRPAMQPESEWIVDYGVAAAAVCMVTIVTVIMAAEAFHWCVVPLVMCGTLMGSDAYRWLRGKFDTFDPKALIGLYGVYFFFLAPLMFVASNAEMPNVRNPPDWRPWLGAMGFANLAGILVYKIVERWAQERAKPLRTKWVMVPGRTGPILCSGIVLSFVSFLYVLNQLGGFAGMARAFTEDSTSLYGIGAPRIVSYSLPLLCFFALTIYRRKWSRPSVLPVAFGVLALVGILQVAISGWSTARGESATAVFWVVIGIHYFWRRIGRLTLLWIVIPMILLLWVYSFYKVLGVRTVNYVRGGASVADLVFESQRTFSNFLLGDMSRADIQAYILWVQTENPEAYDKRWGETYVTAVTPVIPSWVWPGKPDHSGKLVAGTELLYGRNYYNPAVRAFSSHAYGMVGEAMLNYGVWGVPVVFGLWGFFVGRFRRYLSTVPAGDLRLLATPFLTYFLLTMPLWDSDNYLAHSMIRAGFALLVLFLAVGRSHRRTMACTSASMHVPVRMPVRRLPGLPLRSCP
jgi:hypothetical protein